MKETGNRGSKWKARNKVPFIHKAHLKTTGVVPQCLTVEVNENAQSK